MKDLTQGGVTRNLFNFALPMFIGNIFQQLYNVTDSIIVGQIIGKEALGAVGASFPVIFILIAMIEGIGLGGTILIAQYYGAKQMDNVKKTVDTMYVFVFFASLVITAVGVLFSEQILILMQTPANVLPQAKSFLTITFYGMTFMVGYFSVAAALRGLGDSKTPLYFLIFSTFLNIGLVFLFVLGFKMGVAGSALATVIAQSVAFFCVVIYLNKTHPLLKLNVFKMQFDWEIFKQSIRIGLPTGLQQTLVAGGMMLLISIVNRFGTNAIAAFTAASRMDSLAFMPIMNLSSALATFTGQNLGAGKTGRVKRGFRSSVLLSVGISLTISLLFVFFGKYLISFFNTDPSVLMIGSHYLSIVGVSYALLSVMFMTTGVLRGAGATLVPLIVTIASLWFIRIPLASLLSDTMASDMIWDALPSIMPETIFAHAASQLAKLTATDGIWISFPISWAIGMIIGLVYYYTGRWQNKAVIGKVPEELME